MICTAWFCNVWCWECLWVGSNICSWFVVAVVAQTEAASTAESQPAEDPQTSWFTWTIENFTRINAKKHYSDAFVVGGYKW